jgi:hypothetical protein
MDGTAEHNSHMTGEIGSWGPRCGSAPRDSAHWHARRLARALAAALYRTPTKYAMSDSDLTGGPLHGYRHVPHNQIVPLLVYQC